MPFKPALALLAILLLAPIPALAQNSENPLAAMGAAGGPAINIEADDALEWRRAEQTYLARGNVRIQRGDTVLKASEVVLHYRTPTAKSGSDAKPAAGAMGGIEIWQMTADGGVEITSPTATITGGRGVYVIDSQTAILTGSNLKLTTKTDTITARDSLEYHGAAQKAYARGAARAVREKNVLSADTLEATLGRNPAGQMVMKTVTATGGVTITTPTEVLKGETGRYDLAANTARLDGGVKLTRGQTQLNGASAEVDMNTGVSKLAAGPSTGGRVRALFVPGQDAPIPGTKP